MLYSSANLKMEKREKNIAICWSAIYEIGIWFKHIYFSNRYIHIQ